jgi:hypothetical protein
VMNPPRMTLVTLAARNCCSRSVCMNEFGKCLVMTGSPSLGATSSLICPIRAVFCRYPSVCWLQLQPLQEGWLRTHWRTRASIALRGARVKVGGTVSPLVRDAVLRCSSVSQIPSAKICLLRMTASFIQPIRVDRMGLVPDSYRLHLVAERIRSDSQASHDASLLSRRFPLSGTCATRVQPVRSSVSRYGAPDPGSPPRGSSLIAPLRMVTMRCDGT